MELLGKSLTELKTLISAKKISGSELFSYFQKRIKKYNPDLNAYLTLAEDQSFSLAGALSGLPLAIKDNFATRSMRTTASSKVLDTFVPPYNATVVTKLMDAGVINLGKTNMDAWAHGSSTETSDYGPTLNPWDTTRAPGGSSGGSAAAVSAYLAPASIGSETAGSIRQPAAWCGVVGLKPTYGRVSRYGVVAMGSSFDCPGPMTRSVEDAALLLQTIAGADPYDATTSPVTVPDYTTLMKAGKKMTLGISDDYMMNLSPGVQKKIEEAIEVFKKMGHTIKKIKLLDPSYSISVYTILQRAEVSSNLARYTGVRYGNDRSYFASEAKRRIMLGTYTLSYGYYDAFYKKAQKVKTLIIEDFKKAFAEVDGIIAPTTPSTAIRLGEFEKYPFFGEMMDVLNEPAAVAGLPAINIPVGLDEHALPVGMQIMGNYFAEGTILDIAHQYERETNFMDVIKSGAERFKD